MLPVSVFTFANCPSSHLDLLKEESTELIRTLGPLHDKGALEVYREESASVEDLIQIFMRFQQRICIFHYAGHAGGKELHLEGGVGHAHGLAALFQQQKDNLGLVFLNGCSTKGQVQKLMELGIKAVIATSVPIEDKKAKEFATWFYQALAMRNTLEKSFSTAVAGLQSKYGLREVSDKPVFHRSIDFNFQSKTEEIPWGLYINERHPEAVEWRLPSPQQAVETFKRNQNFQSNDYLYSILEAMFEFDPEKGQTLLEEHGEVMDEREYLDIIIKNFPWPIGAQLQKLVAFSESMARPGKTRLEQIASTYFVTSQMMLHILISQLWEESRNMEVLNNQHVMEVLSIDKESYITFDYLGQMNKLHESLKQGEPFITEMKEVFRLLSDTQSDLYKSYLFMELIKCGLWDKNICHQEASQLCEEAEYHLALILCHFAFLANYQMIAVRDIKILNHRHKAVEYQHKMGELNAYAESRLGLQRTPKSLANFTHCNSILLVKDPNGMEEFLSLSPFVIDKNTFLDNSQIALNIFMFAYRDKHTGEYVYQGVNTPMIKEDVNAVNYIHTGFRQIREIKKGIRFKSRGLEGIKKTTEIRPYSLLREQFDALQDTFRYSNVG